VRDEHGKVVETANNSAGIYSRLQTVLAPPSVERVTLYEETSTYKVIIKCPGYVNLHHNEHMIHMQTCLHKFIWENVSYANLFTQIYLGKRI
jgi:hypothetical protein